MVAMTLALAVAGGGNVFGWSCAEPKRVLYIDGEQDERTVQKRFGALASSVDSLDHATANANLLYTGRTGQAVGHQFIDIMKSAHAEEITRTLKKQRVDFVVFDNLSTLTDSLEDENSAAQFKPMQALFAQLKGANIASMLVHHSGKDQTKYRGSSNIATTFERVLGLQHDEKTSPLTLAVRVQLEKFRDKAPDGFQSEFHLELAERPEGRGKLIWKVGNSSVLRRGWHMYSSGEYANNAEFIEAFNKEHHTTYHASNVSVQFVHRWISLLGVTREQIKEAQLKMRERRKCKEAFQTESIDESEVAAF